MMDKQDLEKDLTPFADIGSTAPRAVEKEKAISVSMVRNGVKTSISLDKSTNKIVYKKEGFPNRSFASLQALLASEEFGNLRKWAQTQADTLNREVPEQHKLLPVSARTHRGQDVENITDIDNMLGSGTRPIGAAEVLLIDGPAGIGKTNLIEQLARYRAVNYSNSSKALILHVKSRGRVLSNLQDLMAFSLQTIRSSTTYDQVPILAKHGLVVIAIDGFDELGDPNGYELAWSQVNDLLETIRGKGSAILSGRDTFVGRDRLFRDVQSLRIDHDVVTGLTLKSPSSLQAKDWLTMRGWSNMHLSMPAVATLLEEDSFALRPVFLTLLVDNVKPRDLRTDGESYLTPLLIRQMIKREAALFGKGVDAAMTRLEIEDFLLRYAIEVARELSDSQTEAIDESTLSWMAEAYLPSDIPSDVSRIIKNRVGVFAFFRADQRPNYRSFIHSHIQNYFLSLSTIEVIGSGQTPKYIRRNLFTSDFLSVFSEVGAKAAGKTELNSFINRALNLNNLSGGLDRSSRNVGALILAIVHSLEPETLIENFDVDESLCRGTCQSIKFKDITIHQLDVRDADLGSATFTDCKINHLIANNGSRFSESFPIPSLLSLDNNTASEVPAADIANWLAQKGRNPSSAIGTALAPAHLAAHPVYKLLGRACRVRSYWLRPGDDIQGDKILKDENWEMLSSALLKSGLLRQETRQASGASSVFTHIRKREALIAEDGNDSEIAQFFSSLAEKVLL